MTKVWNDEQGAVFAARLQSASLDGLNLPPLRAQYMVQYKKSLIGKHYKALQQVGIFQLDAQLCSSALFELWKANGVLGGQSLTPRESHRNANSTFFPMFHRGVLSNHEAPSIGIATTLADMECFKHQLSSSWWKPSNGDRTQAGYEIQTFSTGNRPLQRRSAGLPVILTRLIIRFIKI
ncbi:hypothetical protein B0H13DRAFT_1885414 [Mycena leptocephala]|nr:hypothetical protein B0H13DRAFT_1885414 [Mycena leptocephala]